MIQCDICFGDRVQCFYELFDIEIGDQCQFVVGNLVKIGILFVYVFKDNDWYVFYVQSLCGLLLFFFFNDSVVFQYVDRVFEFKVLNR